MKAKNKFTYSVIPAKAGIQKNKDWIPHQVQNDVYKSVRGSILIMYKFLCCIILLFILSCSSEMPSGVNIQKPQEADKGVSETTQISVSVTGGPYSLEITPKEANRNTILKLVSRGFSLSDAKIVWSINGNLIGNTDEKLFKAAETKKGDIIHAKAIINDKEILSDIVTIKNSPPEISRVKVFPEVFKPGDTLGVEVSGSDIDGDVVSFTYEWTKNGEPAGNDEKLSSPVKKGDKISIKITPLDGEAYGRPVTLQREVMNMPPMIIGDKRFTFDGTLYTYQVKANDPDGDPLTYSLKSAPSGMTIDSSSGLIQWKVPNDFRGNAPVTVSVDDGHGGNSSMSFVVEITAEAKK